MMNPAPQRNRPVGNPLGGPVGIEISRRNSEVTQLFGRMTDLISRKEVESTMFYR